MSSSSLATRELGNLTVSIGTSLALESCFGTTENQPTDVEPLKDFTHLWVNLRTIFRNIYGSMPSDALNGIEHRGFAVTMFEEVQVVRERVKEQTNGGVEVRFYYCTYKNLANEFPKANLKTINTVKQQMYNDLEEKALKEVKTYFEAVGQQLDVFDVRLKNLGERVLILTHLPVDLVVIEGFSAVTLLESHTGKTKSKSQWNSKFSTSMDVSRIPFDRMTIQLFGDGKMFGPSNKEYREKIIRIAEKHQWNPTTTKSRILLCIQVEREPIMEAEIRKLY